MKSPHMNSGSVFFVNTRWNQTISGILVSQWQVYRLRNKAHTKVPHTYVSDIPHWWEWNSCLILKQMRIKQSCCFWRKSNKNKTSLVQISSPIFGLRALSRQTTAARHFVKMIWQIRNLGRVWSAETARNKTKICWLHMKTHLITIIGSSESDPEFPPPSSASSKAYF